MLNKSNVKNVEKLIGVAFNSKDLLSEALTHRSLSNEKQSGGSGVKNNERLEFIGDAILSMVVTDYIYHRLPEFDEGVLTKIRAACTSRQACNQVGRDLSLGAFISVGKSVNIDVDGDSILGCAVEAVIGAVFVDQGVDVTASLINRLFCPIVDRVVNERSWEDPKMKFQEKLMSMSRDVPEYKVLDTEKHQNNTFTYTVGVFVNGDMKGLGQGGKKTIAEKAAAADALNKLGW